MGGLDFLLLLFLVFVFYSEGSQCHSVYCNIRELMKDSRSFQISAGQAQF